MVPKLRIIVIPLHSLHGLRFADEMACAGNDVFRGFETQRFLADFDAANHAIDVREHFIVGYESFEGNAEQARHHT